MLSAGVCTPCSNLECKATQYRAGSCKGPRNGLVCIDQPTCNQGEFLAGAVAGMHPGLCTPCTNLVCNSTHYQKGECTGDKDGLVCLPIMTATVATVNVSFYHPDIDAEYEAGRGIPDDHPDVQPLLESNLPPIHPPLMLMLATPKDYPLPFFHPNLSIFQVQQACPGALSAPVECAVLFLSLFLLMMTLLTMLLTG